MALSCECCRSAAVLAEGGFGKPSGGLLVSQRIRRDGETPNRTRRQVQLRASRFKLLLLLLDLF